MADVPRVLAIRHAAFAVHAPAAYSPGEVETLLHDVDPDELRAFVSDGRLFVARRDGVVAGVAGWQDRRVRHVYVDPRHQRQGIASALLRHVEADCRRRTGADLITAGVALHAEAFYRANGYALVRRAVAWDGSAYLEMVKDLRARQAPSRK